jgi:hypothetical protein
MQSKGDVKLLMAVLTFADIIIFAVFVLILSSGKQMEAKQVGAYLAVNSVLNETSSDGSGTYTAGVSGQTLTDNDYDMMDDTSSIIIEQFSASIVGYYTVSNMYFHFYKESGRYDGFFDNSRPDITSGSYEIKMKDGEPVVYIYDPAKNLCVYYYLSRNNAGNIVLTHKASNTKFELKS